MFYNIYYFAKHKIFFWIRFQSFGSRSTYDIFPNVTTSDDEFILYNKFILYINRNMFPSKSIKACIFDIIIITITMTGEFIVGKCIALATLSALINMIQTYVVVVILLNLKSFIFLSKFFSFSTSSISTSSCNHKKALPFGNHLDIGKGFLKNIVKNKYRK